MMVSQLDAKQQLTHDTITTNGLDLHVVQAGPQDGPVVILLHGYPEFWYGWRSQIEALTAAGYRVWAPDQRGYNLSDKPKGLDAYKLSELAADVVGLIEVTGRQKVRLIGHDWGAVVAWWVAHHYPHYLDKLVVINVPHPFVLLHYWRSSMAQIFKSFYVLIFQLPWLPEFLMRLGHGWLLAFGMRVTSRDGTFSNEILTHYRRAWSQPGAMTAMLNWYRALLRRQPAVNANMRITTPTLLIWGARDAFLSRGMAQLSIDLCDDGRLVFVEEAGHWVIHEEIEQVNSLLLNFFNEK